YKDVRNGGFAVESELGLTASQVQNAEMRVILKDSDSKYISLGRTNAFCTTAGGSAPVFNFNGQWPHLNGQPLPLFQYQQFKGDNGQAAMSITAKIQTLIPCILQIPVTCITTTEILILDTIMIRSQSCSI
ncbi:MAG: hypothetical protein K6G22_00215, partial [Lachnospiraceae bacterium]|nr:hypothetical protein [Lachnospiraceae bacterium]